MADELIGLADGVNQKFAVSYEYSPGKIEILYNGQVLTSPDDFDEYGDDTPTASGLEPNEIRFVYLKPLDITVLRANYQVGDCAGGVEDGPGGSTPSEPGATSFLELTDTPTTYSGFENYFVKINAAGDGIEFASSVGDTSGIIEGIEPVVSGTMSVDVVFDSAVLGDYVLTVSLENTGDTETSIYPVLIKNKNTMGFTAEFSGDIDTDNYRLHWRTTDPAAGVSTSFGDYSLSAVTENSSPELGGDIDLGDNLIILDPSPNGMTSHGYEIGNSGEASPMVVIDNPTGYACPLYFRPDGKLAACSAAEFDRMPCAALALEEDEGFTKVFWKGNIRKGNWSWTPGQKIYVSTVEGAITNVKPNGGTWPQVIGIAISKDTIRFDPDLTTENPNGGN